MCDNCFDDLGTYSMMFGMITFGSPLLKKVAKTQGIRVEYSTFLRGCIFGTIKQDANTNVKLIKKNF